MDSSYRCKFFSVHVNLIGYLLLFPFIMLLGCKPWFEGDFLNQQQGGFEELRSYENDYGSRIDLYIELAEKELIENYRKKEYLMIRESQPPAVLHPRKDLNLRELINSAFKDGHISDAQKLAYTKKCDHLYSLWEKHWRIADKKARRLGFER